MRSTTAVLAGVLWMSSAYLCAAEESVDIKLSVKDRVEESESRDEVVQETASGTEITTTTDLEKEVCTLTVKVRQSSLDQLTCKIEWYFLSEHTKDNQSDEVVEVFSPGSEEVRLQKSEWEELRIDSDPFVFKTVRRSNSSSDDQISGDTYKGYIVLVTHDGAILAKESNSSRYLKEEWIKKCKSQ